MTSRSRIDIVVGSLTGITLAIALVKHPHLYVQVYEPASKLTGRGTGYCDSFFIFYQRRIFHAAQFKILEGQSMSVSNNTERESQVDAARRIYNARAPKYEEDGWHPAYSRRLMQEIAPAKPGERVLILACGTGLESFVAAEQVGIEGEVVGIDVAEGMLKLAQEKLEREVEARNTGKWGKIRFLRGDVTKLGVLDDELRDTRAPEEGTPASLEFDMVICSNAFVLLEDPEAAVRGWKRYLSSSSGRLVVDITHERNLVGGVAMSKTARRLGLDFPLSRDWVQSSGSFTGVLEGEGYVVEKLEVVENLTGRGNMRMGLDRADEQFDWIVERRFTPSGVENDMGDFKRRALPVFREEWAKMADEEGKVENVDSLYVYVARKQ